MYNFNKQLKVPNFLKNKETSPKTPNNQIHKFVFHLFGVRDYRPKGQS